MAGLHWEGLLGKNNNPFVGIAWRLGANRPAFWYNNGHPS